MKLLGVDFEAQHEDAETTPITEIGAVALWRGLPVQDSDREAGWGNQDFAWSKQLSQLVYHPGYPPQDPEIVELTGITDEMLKKDGMEPKAVMPLLCTWVAEADYVIAYNKLYDETLFKAVCTRLSLPIPDTPWICGLADLPWPGRKPCMRLSHLAFDKRVPFDPDSLHRATDDALLMFKTIFKCFTWEEIMAYYNTPWSFLKAEIPPPWIGRGGDGGTGRDVAKKHGYSYEYAKGTDTPHFPKAWVKRVKSTRLDAEVNALSPYKVTVLEGLA